MPIVKKLEASNNSLKIRLQTLEEQYNQEQTNRGGMERLFDTNVLLAIEDMLKRAGKEA